MPHLDRHPLARAPGIEIDACRCGAIHLTIGALTLRLEPAAFDRLSATIAEAELARALVTGRARPTVELLV